MPCWSPSLPATDGCGWHLLLMFCLPIRQGHQEFIVGLEGRDGTLANAMSQSALFGLTTTTASQEVLGVIAVVNRWREHFKDCGVTDADLANLAERIDGGELLAMRQSFKAVD